MADPTVNVPAQTEYFLIVSDGICADTISQVVDVRACMSLGSTIFYDDNNNGLQDPTEEGLGFKDKFVDVDLIDANTGALVATTTTDANGDYLFTDLLEGQYIVEFTPPASAQVSSTGAGSDNQVDGDDNGNQTDSNGDGLTDGRISSGVITLTKGQEPSNESFQGGMQDDADDENGDMTVDFGLVRLVSIGSTVFSDDNNNGVQDPGEDSLGSGSKAGKSVTLELYDNATGQLVATTTTDNHLLLFLFHLLSRRLEMIMWMKMIMVSSKTQTAMALQMAR